MVYLKIEATTPAREATRTPSSRRRKGGNDCGRGGTEEMDKEQTAIERLRTASAMSLKVYGEPLLVTTSGGKDSSVCTEIGRAHV